MERDHLADGVEKLAELKTLADHISLTACGK